MRSEKHLAHAFSRTELLIGPEGINRLKESTVAVLGIGGVGSYTAEALARSGIGRIALIDRDVVDLTNINRQIPALTTTIGRAKVDVMKERIESINPDCEVLAKRFSFSEETQDELFRLAPDYVADAIDTISAKIALAAACVRREVPIVSSMGAANKLDPTKFRIMDIYDTSVDPIARVMRRELRERGIKALKVVCSLEPPQEPLEEVRKELTESLASQGLPRKATHPPASISFVPPVAGLILAGAVIMDLAQESGTKARLSQPSRKNGGEAER